MLKKAKLNSKAIYLFLCIFAAFSLWVYVSYVENPDMTRWVRDIPVTVINEEKLNDNGLAILQIEDMTVDLKVKAKRSMFTSLSSDSIKAIADVSTIGRTGENVITASVSFPSSSTGVTIVDRRKMDVEIIVDEYITQNFTLEPDIAKAPPEDFFVNSQKLQDGTSIISVSGCKTNIESISHITTNQVDLSAETKNVTRKLNFTPVDYDDNPVPNVKLAFDSAPVTFEIYKSVSVPLELKLYADNPKLEYSIDPPSVRIHGPAESVDAITSIIVGTINEYDFSPNETKRISIQLPQSISLRNGEEHIAKLTFKAVENTN